MGLEPKRVKNAQLHSGMVLLLSLSVILLMSIALMEAFERKSIEVAHLRNSADVFQTETLTRSMLKVILLAVKENGLISLFKFRQIIEGQIFPIENVPNGYFEIVELQPLDHLFNLNRKIISANSVDRSIIFHNLVNQIRKQDNPDNLGVAINETEEALSALIDWTDVDGEMDSVFMHDHERYPDEYPSFDVKNQRLDRVSEIKLIQPMRALGLVDTETYLDFFRAGLESSVEAIDVNLAEKNDIALFLERFEGVADYATVFDQRTRIDEIATTQEESTATEDLLSSFGKPTPRFAIASFNTHQSEWLEKLATVGIELNQKEKLLFKPLTDYLRVRFLVGVRNVTVSAETIIQLSYAQNSGVIQKITILSFSTR